VSGVLDTRHLDTQTLIYVTSSGQLHEFGFCHSERQRRISSCWTAEIFLFLRFTQDSGWQKR